MSDEPNVCPACAGAPNAEHRHPTNDLGSQPAYPLEYSLVGEASRLRENRGLTKRELFAAMAMQGLLASERSDFAIKSEKDLAECAVLQADALLTALDVPGKAP